MLILKGQIIHKNLSTTYTQMDQFMAGLQKQQFTGLCTVSFWEYDGVLFLVGGDMVNGLEEIGIRAPVKHTGDRAIQNILDAAREKGGELNVYTLPEAYVAMLSAALHVAPKYENLSTDLTSLDKLIALLQKEALSGYIEVLLENEAGTANLFFIEGELIGSVLAPPDNKLVADTASVQQIDDLCQQHNAVFNVYQANEMSATAEAGSHLEGPVPRDVISLFETILTHLEIAADAVAKPGTFQKVFKSVLPQLADTYVFLDPFVGDFHYTTGKLAYTGDANYKEFTDGACEAINRTLATLVETLDQDRLLLRLSTEIDSVSTAYPDLIEHLDLETRMPLVFQDYAFLKNSETDAKSGQKRKETRSVLNLQGVGMSDVGSDSILREFYRVIAAISHKYYDPATQTMQYATLKKSREFSQYQTATAFLQKFDLAYLQNRNDMLAFWLNLYNFLVIDGIVEFGVTKSVHDTKGLFTKTSYRLGEYLFSLDDIEHGILRNNKRRPYAVFRQFSGSDPRKTFCIAPVDNRLHCCFACGAVSSPPLRVYAPQQIETQIAQATSQFLTSEKGLRLDRDKQELWLNRLFYWYRKDFETSRKTLIDFVLEHVQEPDTVQYLTEHCNDLTLRFMEYDWRLNGK
jgi:hypothetical protein